jgi:hypothetical protein
MTNHTDVVAYAFDTLEEPDRLEFEAHLSTCDECRAELSDLGTMTDMFADFKRQTTVEAPQTEEEPESSPDNVVDLVRRRKRTDRRRRIGNTVLTAAAAVAILGAGITLGSAANGHAPSVGIPGTHNGPAAQLEMYGEKHSATAATGTTGTVALMKLGWGTHVALELSKLKGPLECDLIAVSKTGEERVVTGWSVPVAGYGTPQHKDPLVVHGGTSIPRDQLARFDVRIVGGGNLLSVPV